MSLGIRSLKSFLILLSAICFAACTIGVAGGQGTSADLPTDCSAYQATPLPAEADTAPIPETPPDCASYKSYHGIGRPTNYSEARECAWKERLASKVELGQNPKQPLAWVVGGPLILADIYYNGAGVKRDVPLAIRFACEFEEATARLALRDLRKVDRGTNGRLRFEFCDYAATTFSMNFCGGYASEISDDRVDRYFKSVKSAMLPEQKTAFDKLLATKKAYVEIHAREVYQGGTIRGIRTMGSEDILKDLFRTEIVHFERKQWPTLTATQISTADIRMEQEYKRNLTQRKNMSKEAVDEGEVTAENLAEVQNAWKAYREAWTAFARVRYPSAVDAIRARDHPRSLSSS